MRSGSTRRALSTAQVAIFCDEIGVWSLSFRPQTIQSVLIFLSAALSVRPWGRIDCIDIRTEYVVTIIKTATTDVVSSGDSSETLKLILYFCYYCYTSSHDSIVRA